MPQGSEVVRSYLVRSHSVRSVYFGAFAVPTLCGLIRGVCLLRSFQRSRLSSASRFGGRAFLLGAVSFVGWNTLNPIKYNIFNRFFRFKKTTR